MRSIKKLTSIAVTKISVRIKQFLFLVIFIIFNFLVVKISGSDLLLN